VLRVLAAEGIALPGNPRRDPVPRAPWPDWLEWKPNRIWAYDFTHFTRAGRAAIAILDMVSRKWLTTSEFLAFLLSCFLSFPDWNRSERRG